MLRASRAATSARPSPTAAAVPNRPAWPATPPSAAAFSSCTSPCSSRSAPRIVLGRGDPRHASPAAGRNVERTGRRRRRARQPSELVVRAIAPPTSSSDEPEQDEAEIAVDRSRARRVLERLIGRSRARSAARSAERCESTTRCAGRPEQCSSRSRTVTAVRSAARHSANQRPASRVEPPASADVSCSGDGRGRQDLGQRRQVEDRVVVDRRAASRRTSSRPAAYVHSGR